MTRKIVLLEGGEGAGKTTIANMLQERNNFEYVKFPTPNTQLQNIIFSKTATVEEKAIAATLDFCTVLRTFQNSNNDLVLDRGPLSTIAYQGPHHFYNAIRALKAEWTIRILTHVFLFDVDVERGLGREVIKNAVSEAGMEFHQRCNRRMRVAVEGLKIYRESTQSFVNLNLSQPLGDDLPSQWDPVLKMREWPSEVHRIDTNNTQAEEVYGVVLERLGLVSKA